MEYKFEEDSELGKVVSEVKAFCKLTKTSKDITEKYIVGDYADFNRYPGLAGKKWSRLCGFTFRSNKNNQCFQFVFVPKIKGSMARNQKALSGWYCWTLFSNTNENKQVTSINAMKSTFGFNVNKFVHSDLFDKYIPIFKANINYVLNNQIKDLLAQPKDSFDDYTELVRYVDAIKDSIQKIDEVKQYVTDDNVYDDSNNPDYAKGSAPKVGHVKIAYNADKTYDLRNMPKNIQQQELRKQAIQNIADKMNAAKEKNSGKVDAKQANTSNAKDHIKFDPTLKYKFGGGRNKKSDAEIFDKYDDYDNDDFR